MKISKKKLLKLLKKYRKLMMRDKEKNFMNLNNIYILNQLLEDLVKTESDTFVFKDGFEHLTYKEINEKAKVLAKLLKRKGLDSNTNVAINLDYSKEAIVGTLAIMKAGGKILPMGANVENKLEQKVVGNPRMILTKSYIDKKVFETKSKRVGKLGMAIAGVTALSMKKKNIRLRRGINKVNVENANNTGLKNATENMTNIYAENINKKVVNNNPQPDFYVNTESQEQNNLAVLRPNAVQNIVDNRQMIPSQKEELSSLELKNKLLNAFKKYAQMKDLKFSDDFMKIIGGDKTALNKIINMLKSQGLNVSLEILSQHKTINKLTEYVILNKKRLTPMSFAGINK
jgi:hypothetical protein